MKQRRRLSIEQLGERLLLSANSAVGLESAASDAVSDTVMESTVTNFAVESQNDLGDSAVDTMQMAAEDGEHRDDIQRLDDKVIAHNLEGDPDRPIIMGRVYHAENIPNLDLPDGKVISGMKSNSDQGGGGYNEYILDDTKGNELIREHGQFDKDATIEHDLREHVLNDRSRDVTNNETIQIGVDRTQSVANNEEISVGNERATEVGHDETKSVGSNQTHTVGSNETVTVTLSRTHSVGVNETISIGAAQEVTVGGLRTITVGAQQTNIGRTTGKASISLKKDGTIANDP